MQYVNLSCVCLSTYRQFVFAAFTKEFISAPFTEQIFHFFIPALSDIRFSFPFEAFLSSLQATVGSSSAPQSQAPWVFYFVLSAGENRLGGWHSLGLCTHASVCAARSLYVYGSFEAWTLRLIYRDEDMMMWTVMVMGVCWQPHYQRRVSCCTYGLYRHCCLCCQCRRAAAGLKLAATRRTTTATLASIHLPCR